MIRIFTSIGMSRMDLMVRYGATNQERHQLKTEMIVGGLLLLVMIQEPFAEADTLNSVAFSIIMVQWYSSNLINYSIIYFL